MIEKTTMEVSTSILQFSDLFFFFFLFSFLNKLAASSFLLFVAIRGAANCFETAISLAVYAV